MRINNECARKVLLEVEKIPFGGVITVNELCEKIGEYSIEDVIDIVTNFNRINYLIIYDKRGYDESDVLRDNKIKCLTDRGFEALDPIRSDELWKLMKEKIDNFNEISIYTIINTARRVMNVKYNELFDLPRDY